MIEPNWTTSERDYTVDSASELSDMDPVSSLTSPTPVRTQKAAAISASQTDMVFQSVMKAPGDDVLAMEIAAWTELSQEVSQLRAAQRQRMEAVAAHAAALKQTRDAAIEEAAREATLRRETQTVLEQSAADSSTRISQLTLQLARQQTEITRSRSEYQLKTAQMEAKTLEETLRIERAETSAKIGDLSGQLESAHSMTQQQKTQIADLRDAMTLMQIERDDARKQAVREERRVEEIEEELSNERASTEGRISVLAQELAKCSIAAQASADTINELRTQVQDLNGRLSEQETLTERAEAKLADILAPEPKGTGKSSTQRAYDRMAQLKAEILDTKKQRDDAMAEVSGAKEEAARYRTETMRCQRALRSAEMRIAQLSEELSIIKGVPMEEYEPNLSGSGTPTLQSGSHTPVLQPSTPVVSVDLSSNSQSMSSAQPLSLSRTLSRSGSPGPRSSSPKSQTRSPTKIPIRPGSTTGQVSLEDLRKEMSEFKKLFPRS